MASSEFELSLLYNCREGPRKMTSAARVFSVAVPTPLNMPSDDEVEAFLLGLDPLIRGMIRKRMRVSLSPADASRENQNALEIHGDIWVELYRKLRSDTANIRNL